jgi:hypothetical protein
VVVPFRQQQPDYQRRWRWSRQLREIRERTSLLGGAVLASLRRLVCWAERLIRQAPSALQAGILAGEKLGCAVAAVQRLGQDVVRAAEWLLGELDALVLERMMRASEGDSASSRAGCCVSSDSASGSVSTSWGGASIAARAG